VQDEVLRLAGGRSEERQMVEKKMAIYERALRHHPGSDTLLLALLHETGRVEDADTTIRAWRRTLGRHGGSVRLWRAYLSYRRGHFSTFSVASMRRICAEALQALGVERARRAAAGAPEEVVAEVAEGQLAVLMDLCELESGSGHTELMVARLQVS
jgi:hypothetical protein